ncbi:MAG: aromatic amino acid lyase, partial [Salinarimonas sp.]
MPAPPAITLTGGPLSFDTLVRIGAGVAVPRADEDALARVRRARAAIDRAIEAGVPVYGATTGVGAMKDVSWS